MNNEINQEEMEKAVSMLRKMIIDSNMLLMPNAIISDEERLDEILGAFTNIFKKNKHFEMKDLPENDRNVLALVYILFIKALSEAMKKDPQMTLDAYDQFMSGFISEGSPMQQKLFKEIVKSNLIEHEEYEKIPALDKVEIKTEL